MKHGEVIDWKEFVAKAAADRPTLFRRTLLLAGRLDPIGLHHVKIVEHLCQMKQSFIALDPTVPVRVLVWPIGPYAGKPRRAPAAAQKEMILDALAHLGDQVEVNTYDLDTEKDPGTPTFEMQVQLSYTPHTEMREKYFTPLNVPSIVTEVWHVLGADNVDKISDWEQGSELYKNARFLVLTRKGHEVKGPLPKGALVVDFGINGASTDICAAIKKGDPWEHLVPDGVARITKRDGFYGYTQKRSVTA